MGEEKKEESGADQKKGDEKQPEPEPKPEPVVLKVDMHCAGCAREVRKSIKSFKGVEHFEIDMHLNKVTVKGNVDPLKLRERVQKKSGRKTELISPLVLPNTVEPEKEKIKPEENKAKPEPVVVTVVLNVNMHCEACAQTVKKTILKMKGVQTVDSDFKSQKVTVKGTVDPKRLAERVYRRTGKRVEIQSTTIEGKSQDSDGKTEVAGSENKDEAKPVEGEKKEDKKEDSGGEEKKEEAKPDDDKGGKKDVDENNGEVKKDGEDKKDTEPPTPVKEEDGAVKIDGIEAVMFEAKKFEVSYPRYVIEHVHPPQLFSDENPNACSIM